jgi:hypothetical protein
MYISYKLLYIFLGLEMAGYLKQRFYETLSNALIAENLWRVKQV